MKPAFEITERYPIYSGTIIHHGERRIKLVFKYNTEVIKAIKNLPGCRWSQTMKCWHIPYRDNYKEYLEKELNGICNIVTQQHRSLSGENLHENVKGEPDYEVTNNRKDFLKIYHDTMCLKRLSPLTQKIYSEFFREFLNIFDGNDIDEHNYKTIYDYIKKRAENLGYTRRKQMIAAIKFYYEKVLGRERMYFYFGKQLDLKNLKLSLSLFSLQKILDEIHSPQDRLLLFLAYYINITPGILCKLRLNCECELKRLPQVKGEASFYLSDLIEKHKEIIPNKKYLFEKDGMPLTAVEIRKKVYRIISYYKIETLYKEYGKMVLQEAGYARKTKEIYLSIIYKGRKR